ncbi:CapA family protein [Ornithinimicrobium sp. Y1847]|uniref:CapA family protein n=1 Tax=Ornithinimicrobium sp. Y1847 TaxID=3405419 RepID=UPI003B67B8F2
MRQHRALALAATCSLLVLTGCSGDGPDEQDSSPAGQTGSTDGGADADSATVPPPGGSEGAEQGDGDTEGDGTDGGGDDGQNGSAEPLEVTISAFGDILAHSRVNVTANRNAGGGEGEFDYRPMFADVKPLLEEADLTLCHMETPLSPDNTNLSVPDVLIFNTPYQMADALAEAGVDGCDFASNHTLDMGMQGLRNTEQVIRDAGMGYAGPTADEDRAGLAEFYEVPTETGVARIAQLAYTYTYPNAAEPTTTIPGEAPWLIENSWPNLGSAGILEQAEQARSEGADFVVVSMHWGNEYQAQPTEQQRQIAQDLLTSGDVDLILGTHAHVIQPCEEIDGKQVIYGLGNFLSNQGPVSSAGLLPETQEGMIAQFTLTRDEDGEITSSMTYQPTRVEIDPQALAAGSTGPHIIRLVSPENYPETWERTTSTIDLLGGCGAEPVHP